MNTALVYMNNEMNVGWGAGYVTGALLRAGHEVQFYDTLFTPSQQVAHELRDSNCELLLISSMTLLFPEAIELIRQVKSQKQIPVLVGGIHPTIIGSKLLDQYPEIDYLCLGEGESMVVEFVERFGTKALLEVQNLVYRKNGKAVANSIRPAEDLAKIPRFPWHCFPESSIVQRPMGMVYVNSSRGCPYNCNYCANIVYLKQYKKDYLRGRPVEHVIEELRFLKEKYNPRLFYFGDEMFLSDVKYATTVLETLKKELNTPFGFMARVEHITPEIVDLLTRTGCQYVAMGLECGDEEFRKKFLGRRMSNEKIEHAFSLIKKAGIFVSSFNMIGYPYEGDEYVTEQTVSFNQKIAPDYAQISIFYPFPGTKMHDYCVEHDLIDPGKASNTKDYFGESVLKGVSLRKKRGQIHLKLNPLGFQFAFDEYFKRKNSLEPRTFRANVGFMLRKAKCRLKESVKHRPLLNSAIRSVIKTLAHRRVHS